jgi:hypothetical protein
MGRRYTQIFADQKQKNLRSSAKICVPFILFQSTKAHCTVRESFMRRWIIAVLLLLSLGLVGAPTPAAAQSGITATNDKASLEFPERITFSVNLQSSAEINAITLEYGVEQLTCGAVIAEAFPDFTPSKKVTAQWTWEMKQSGSQPPGAQIWWRWRITDSAGNEQLTEKQIITWLDDQHAWQTLSSDNINLHWYRGGNSFGRELHDSAVSSLTDLTQSTGLQPDSPIDLYIYANTQDLQNAILYEPGWTGGQAYPENNIVIIGITPSQIEWGKRTEAHEMTHVLVGHFGFTCLGSIPTWLNEGLAVYGEGGPESNSRVQFLTAVTANTLISVRALSGSFSEDPAKADLSYSESYSLVNFLIEEYGQDKMLALLHTLRDGATVDEALQTTYGFNIEGLEDAWRAKIGAQPRAASGNLEATPTPTIVPTYVPVSGALLGPTLSPTRTRPIPTPIPTQPNFFSELKNNTGLAFAGTILFCVAAVAVIVVGLIIGLAILQQRRLKL